MALLGPGFLVWSIELCLQLFLLGSSLGCNHSPPLGAVREFATHGSPEIGVTGPVPTAWGGAMSPSEMSAISKSVPQAGSGCWVVVWA